jgi:hypothetical protein
VNRLQWANWSRSGPIAGSPSEWAGSGLRYEHYVQDRLRSTYGERFEDSLWFKYRDAFGVGHIKPDGLLFLPNKVILVEIKLTASHYLWWQLRWVYGPVVRMALELDTLCDVGIVSRFSLPLPDCPEQPHLLTSLDEATPNAFWLHHIRRPRDEHEAEPRK